MPESTDPTVSPRECFTKDPPTPGEEGSLQIVGTDYDTGTGIDRIEDTIADADPDVVAVELDEVRHAQRRTANTESGEDDAVDREAVLSGKTGYQFLGYWLAATVAGRLTEHFKFDSDPETATDAHLEAVETAGATPALVDRPINDTAQRLWARLRYRDKAIIGAALTAELGGPWKSGLGIGMFWGLLLGSIGSMLAGPFLLTDLASGGLAGSAAATLDALIVIVGSGLLFGVPLGAALAVGTRRFNALSVDRDELVDVDPVTVTLQEWCHDAADVDALLNERNAYVAHQLATLRDAGYDVVAVVGEGRRQAIERYVESPSTRPASSELVGPIETGKYRKAAYKGIGYACTVGFLGLFVLLLLGGAQDTFVLELFAAWFLVNFLAAGGVALLFGAHWSSATAGGAVAWLTSVNPMITPGLFIAYVELRYTKVRISDIFAIRAALGNGSRSALTRLRALYREAGLFKLLTIMTFANLASFIASVLFVVLLLPALTTDIGGLGELGNVLADGIATGASLLRDLVGL